MKIGVRKMLTLVEKEGGIKCHYCHSVLEDGKITVDHVVPVKRGGTNEIDNLVIACKSCNSSKRDRSLDTFLLSKELKKIKIKGLIKIITDDRKVTLIVERGYNLKLIAGKIDEILFKNK